MHTIIRLVVLSFVVYPLSVFAEDADAPKPEYYEAAVNGSTVINYKRWNTSRAGKVILTHEERDMTRKESFDQIDTLIYHDGKKVLHFITILGKRSCFFHPEAGCTVLQGDSDGDGRYDRIVLNDAKGQMVDSFTIAADNRITPISDVELKKATDALKKFSEGMKNFDK